MRSFCAAEAVLTEVVVAVVEVVAAWQKVATCFQCLAVLRETLVVAAVEEAVSADL